MWRSGLHKKLMQISIALAATVFDLVHAIVKWWRARFFAFKRANVDTETGDPLGHQDNRAISEYSSNLGSRGSVPAQMPDYHNNTGESFPLLQDYSPYPAHFQPTLRPMSIKKTRIVSLPGSSRVRRDTIERTSGYRRHIMVIN